MTETKLDCQRHLFPLEEGDGYLNGASRSPQLKAVAAAARHAIAWRENNSGMPIEAFFEPVRAVKQEFATLVGAEDAERIALIPAASYGIATAAKNLPLERGQNVIVVEDQFPSNYYAWSRLTAERGAELRIVGRPDDGGSWSDAVLTAIDAKTAAVAIAQIHWADGTVYDLKAIRERTHDVDAWLIVDGTQSVGAMAFNAATLAPDVLACGGYKWLMGPYGCGYAYYGPRMDDGVPLEENWINRAGSEDFRQLVNYREEYRPKAGRYSVGEQSNFLMMPMMLAGLQQLNAWKPERIQAYALGLWRDVLPELEELGVRKPDNAPGHLVGWRLPAGMGVERLKQELAKRRLSVSYRGDAVRVSPNVYNRPGELRRLLEALRAAR